MTNRINTVGELKAALSTLPDDQLVRAGRYDTWSGEWILSYLALDTLFTDPTGSKDLSDKERDSDVPTTILY